MAGVHKVCPVCKAEAWDEQPLPCHYLEPPRTSRASDSVVLYQLASEINVLLAYLRSFNVDALVDCAYLKGYGNPAPGELLRMQMDRLQSLLTEVYKIPEKP